MFDLQAQDGSVRKNEFKSPIPGGEEEGAQSVPVAELDKPHMVARHHQLMAYYVQELDRQAENRTERAHDDDFYDNLQWEADDIAALNDRGQKALVYNVISASVDWVTNTEKRAKSDFKVLPRRAEEAEPAVRKTELLKYLSDANYLPHSRSRAFEDAVLSGLGWLEDGITEDNDGEPLYSGYVDWREMLHDSRAKDFKLDDARFIIRSKWVDLDYAIGMFPKRAGLLGRSADEADNSIGITSHGDDAMDSAELDSHGYNTLSSEYLHGYTRRRVRLIEAWLRIPVKGKKLKGGPFNGEIYDGLSRGHRRSVESGEAEIIERIVPRMHVAIFTPAGMLWFSESPYRHNKFPYTPIWGKRRRRDGQPYGMVRGLKGIQEDINKRASKALHILSTNKVVMDDDALPPETDIETFREEVARPDGIIIKKRGSELRLETDRELSQYQLQLMERSIAMIQQSSGVTDELLGRKTNASSGIAIQRRQDQGSMATAHFFENLRLSSQLQGEKQLANIEQFVSEEKAFRITNSRGKAEYIKVNDGLPENDIIRSKADYVISDADWHASMRQAEVDALLDVVGKIGNPQIMLMVLDLLVENMDLKNRDELVKRIRSMSGMKDPDGDEQEATPEEQAKVAAANEQAAIQKRMLLAEAAKIEGEAEEKIARAAEIRQRIANLGVDAQGKAIDVAAKALTLDPIVSHTADHILGESGFKSASDQAAAAPAPQAALPPPPPPQAMAAAPGLGAMTPA